VGMESGTNKPLSEAKPCMTTERKSKWTCSPRVDEYVTEAGEEGGDDDDMAVIII
jgi:hypothetical protein